MPDEVGARLRERGEVGRASSALDRERAEVDRLDVVGKLAGRATCAGEARPLDDAEQDQALASNPSVSASARRKSACSRSPLTRTSARSSGGDRPPRPRRRARREASSPRASLQRSMRLPEKAFWMARFDEMRSLKKEDMEASGGDDRSAPRHFKRAQASRQAPPPRRRVLRRRHAPDRLRPGGIAVQRRSHAHGSAYGVAERRDVELVAGAAASASWRHAHQRAVLGVRSTISVGAARHEQQPGSSRRASAGRRERQFGDRSCRRRSRIKGKFGQGRSSRLG